MKTINRLTAIALAGSLALSTAKPAQSNPAVLAPALCSTGVGCIVVGVAVVGGAFYWVLQNQQTGRQHYNMIEDPEEEMERMDENAQTGRTIIANSASEAHSKCSRWADGRGVAMPQKLGNNRWLCRYY